nr:hypothetical protein [Tanacetum cinerariifolium]
MAQPDNNTQLSFTFKTFFERETLTGANFNDWYRSLKIVLRVADTYDYLYKPCPDQPLETASEKDKAAWKAEYKKHNDMAYLMLRKMSPALQKQFESYPPQLILAKLKKCYMDQLHALGKSYDNDMAINLINRSLNKDFGDFVRNFNMHCVEKTVTELHALFIEYEKGLKDKTRTPQVLTIQKGKENKPIPQANKKDKSKGKTDKNKKVLDTGRGTALFSSKSCGKNKDKAQHGAAASDVYGPVRHVSRKGASYFLTFTDGFSRYGYVYLLKHKHEVFENFKVFKSEVELQLGKKIKALRSDRGEMAQPDNNTQLSFAFKTFSERETLTGANFNDWYRSLRIVLRVADTYDYLYKPCPDQPLESASEEDKAAWKAEYKKHNDAVKIYELVDALHSCKQAPEKFVSAHVLKMKGYIDQLHALGKSYDNDMAINLINSRYGYVYLLKHKHEVFENFKVFKSEVELQLGNKIKALRSDRGGEYLSQEFKDSLRYLKETMGYYFYFPPENKVILTRYGNFLERDLISQKFSGRDHDLEDDYMDTLPSKNTSEIPVESESLGSPSELIPVCRDRSRRLIGLSQSAYIDKILKKYNMHNSKKGYFPKEFKHDLSNELSTSTPEEVAYIKKVPYALAIGSIMYAVRCTRPDVAFAQNLVSRYQQNLGKLHWVAVKHILKQCDKDDTKSQTAQAEYVAASEAAMEAVWIRKFVGDLGVMPSINKPINMYFDNSAAIIFANEPGIMKGARHFLRRYHYVREQVETGMIIDLAKGIGLQLASSFMQTSD